MQDPKIIAIDGRFRAVKRGPVPLLLVQGLPGGEHSAILSGWLASRKGLNAVLLEPFISLRGREDCPQCVLLENVLSELDGSLNDPSIDGICLVVPFDLDTRLLAERLQEIKTVRLDAVTTWVDARRFLEDFSSDREWRDRLEVMNVSASLLSDETLGQPVLEGLIGQLEFCDAWVLMGTDRISPEEHASIRTILQTIQPGAVQLDSRDPAPWIDRLFSVGLFHPEQTPSRCAWKRIFSDAKSSPAYFKSRRPFHPERLNALIEEWPEPILRSYGTLWIASHPDLALTLSQVGPAGFFISPEGYWVGTLESWELPSVLGDHPELLADWDATYGDRINEIAWVSTEPLASGWVEALERCLLTDLEMRMDWKRFSNPFPTFEEDEDEREDTAKRSSHLRLL